MSIGAVALIFASIWVILATFSAGQKNYERSAYQKSWAIIWLLVWIGDKL